jgi:mycothiol synthase
MGKTGREGMNEPRKYHDERDLEAMHQLLTAGRKAANGTFYIHTGDLSWWLYYPPLEGDFWEHIYLWDDPDHAGRLLGWVLISPDWVGLDVYVQPELRGSDIATDMYLWGEQQAMQVASKYEKQTIYVVWVGHDDEILVKHFSDRGFRLRRGYVQLTRTLDEPIATPSLPEGMVLRSCNGEIEVAARAGAQYAAFGSSAPVERYQERFTRFMQSPVYHPELDLVAAVPGGQITAFCIVWLDPDNRIGHFEPVGTHPDFQRQGLGKAIMLAGLQKLKEAGMMSADVVTIEDNPAAIKLYENSGFRMVNRLGTYEKDV